MKYKFTYFLFILMVLLLACNNKNKTSKKNETSQDTNTKVKARTPKEPQKVEGKDYKKVVVVGDAIAEIVISLLDTSKIVGVHKTLPFLPDFQVDKVGYNNVLKSDFILKTKTEAVFSDEEGSPEAEVEKVKAKKIDYFKYMKPSNIEDTKNIIEEISQRLKKEAKGKNLISKIDSSLTAIQNLVKPRKDSLKVLYVYARGPVVTLTAGKGTPIDEFIKLAGAKNAAEDYEGMEKLSAEEIVALNPHLILMSEESKASLEGKTHQATVLMSSPLYRSNVIFLLKEHDMTNFSVHTAKAAYQLANKLYGTGY